MFLTSYILSLCIISTVFLSKQSLEPIFEKTLLNFFTSDRTLSDRLVIFQKKFFTETSTFVL